MFTPNGVAWLPCAITNGGTSCATPGAHVMVGGCSGVAQDVPPFVIAQGNHATPFGVNIEGLKRRGFSREAITAIRNALAAQPRPQSGHWVHGL